MKRRHERWLDAAGILDSQLRADYEYCRQLHAGFGRTYYLATLLLPPAKRPYVNSLYGFARYADEIVDNEVAQAKAETLTRWSEDALTDLRRGESTDPVCRALLHTMRTWQIPLAHVEAFLVSMLMDLTVTEYPTYDALRRYMYGSAAVIGLQMLPILGSADDEALVHARALGEAFQLTNFIRDVAEDLRLGRVYLPMEDLDAFGVSRESLLRGSVTPRIRELLRFEIHRARRIYAFAKPGIRLLEPSSRDCIQTAFDLYGGILDEVERADYQVLDRRVSVGIRKRASTALRSYLHARRQWGSGPLSPRWGFGS
ncbi:MAG TPA: phytoene/squalene synthase family protein [Pseudonocardiaceae bacterium]